MINIQSLIDDAKCYETVREIRWAEGVRCPHCGWAENVQQKTIQPIITRVVAKGSTFYTDEYTIYDRLKQWGDDHHTLNHSQGESARDADGDGFHEVHVNTLEGFWSLLRSWLRPHRAISVTALLGFFRIYSQYQTVR